MEADTSILRKTGHFYFALTYVDPAWNVPWTATDAEEKRLDPLTWTEEAVEKKTNSAFWHQAVGFDERHYFRKHGEIAVVAKVFGDARDNCHRDAHRPTAHADARYAELFKFAHGRSSRTPQNIQRTAHAAHQTLNRGRILHAGSE